MAAIVVLAFASLPAAASATFVPGPAGKVVFTSGRANSQFAADDNTARLWVADYPGGTPVQVTTQPTGANIQHRHPNWSPDHTRIVYAAGTAFNATGTYALWIKDLRDGTQTEFAPPAPAQDRPSWSPDGTQIAYGSEGDLWVKDLAPGSEPVRVTDNATTTEERPVWSPDGNTLYFNRGVPPFNTGSKRDLYKISPVASTSTEVQITEGEDNDWQPALSPDGGTLCFTRGEMNSTADIWLVNVNGGLATPFATSPSGNINCVWSPDGSHIVYTLGVFGTGDLARREVDGTFSALPSSWSVNERFDGNADWATNFSPVCDPASADIGVNQFTTIQLSCTDPDFGSGASPPEPVALEENDIEIASPPANGALGGITEDGQVIYTPNKDFQGTDTFTYSGSDSVSNAPPATVTINVGTGDGGAGGDRKAPVVSKVRVSPRRWRLGNQLAKISLSPIGTTISFRLSEAARATLTFQRSKPGRKVGRKCVRQTTANRTRKACKRYVGAGRVTKQARAGRNRIRFQGLLTRSRKLSLGSYRVVVAARDAAGNRSKPRIGPTFTIVKK